MNIIKIQDDLKGAPDSALIGYVQNPTGQVPTYLALSELERRKSMREKYQQAQPEKKTIAESIIEEAQPQMAEMVEMPQGGVASLPEAQPMMQAMAPPPEMPMQQMAQGGLAELDTGDMFDEANYASGGIVAFAEGGDKGMNIDELPSLNLNTGESMSQNIDPAQFDARPYNREMEAYFQMAIPGFTRDNEPRYTNAMTAMVDRMVGVKKQEPNSRPTNAMNAMVNHMIKNSQGMAQGGEVQHYAEGGTSKFGDFMRSLGNVGALQLDKQIGVLQAEKEKIRGDIFRSYTPEQKAAHTQRISEIDAQIAGLSAQRKGGAPNTPSTIPGRDVMGSEASAGMPGQNPLSSLANPNAIPGMVSPNFNPNQPPPSAAKPAGDGTDPYALEKVKGIGDYAKELQDYIGVDPARAGLQERLSKMDTKAAKMEEQAPWLAVARAGFEMANQRPEFGKAAETPFASLARGAGAGLKDYVESRDKLTSLEEKRFGIANEIARVDRAEKIAVAKFGADSKQAVEEANRKAKLQRAHDNILLTMNREDNDVRLKAAAAKTGMDPKQILDAKEKIRSGNPTYLNWVNEMTKKSKNIINTPEFKKAEEDLVNELVIREGSLNPTPRLDKSKWSLG